MDITPSPRILRMLGEIEFDEWQCIAELADNAFDDFSEIVADGQAWPGGFKVSVTLPGPGASVSGAEVIVTDTGKGMTRDKLENAVKAGWSSNDRFDKLGLFGMGFNVSTARLGRRTRVLTTRAGDPEWIGVEIDLETFGPDFNAPEISEPKDDPSEHGTKVIVSNLHRDRAEWLQRNAENLRTTLGRVYGWLLDNRPYELWVQGVKVKPRRACRWGDGRYVIYGSGANAEKIPAYIEIDEKFEPADACELCGNWQNVGKDVCDQCGSGELRERERQLHGWLGVQRHLDKRDFGIDFLRNGRKILQYDKSLFNWKNPNDPTGAVDVEYPVELANQGGRLIGEIHLDYVPCITTRPPSNTATAPGEPPSTTCEERRPSNRRKQRQPATARTRPPLPGCSRATAATTQDYAASSPATVPGRCTKRLASGRVSSGPATPTTRLTRNGGTRYWSRGASRARRSSQRHRRAPRTTADEEAVLTALGGGPDSRTSPSDPAVRRPGHPCRPPTQAGDRAGTSCSLYRRLGSMVPELSRDFGLPELGQIKVETRAVADHPRRRRPSHAHLAGAGRRRHRNRAHRRYPRGLHEDRAGAADLLFTEVSAALKVKADSHLTHAHRSRPGSGRRACPIRRSTPR